MAKRALLALAAATVAACGPSIGAGLDPMGPRSATVGVELSIALHAQSPDVVFGFTSDIGDLATRPLRPSLSSFAGGQAVFRWTPLGGDVGDHTLRFSATVGGSTSTASVPVSVRPGADPLRFVEPVGDGTTLDLARGPCADVSVLVEDTGATHVTLDQGALWSEGATLTADGPLSGKLHFCPSAAQAQAQTIFPFSFAASDDSGARAEKRYTVVLGELKTTPPPPPVMPTCDTVGPTITHKPHPNYTGTGNLHLYATAADADGVYDATVFWSTSAPADAANPDLTQMTALDMVPTGGTLASTDYAATLASPVAGGAPGDRVTIYYLLRSTDADDQTQGCAYHTTLDPPAGVFSFVVTHP